MSEILGRSRSLCPVCLAALPADILRRGKEVLIVRRCPEHGEFAGLIWRGEPDFSLWRRPKSAAFPPLAETRSGRGCPHDCGRCPEHGQRACTVLFEITGRCNLRCPVCFAAAGDSERPFAPLEDLLDELRWIHDHAGRVVLQISGGEPTLYPQLPQLVRAGRELFPAVQLNSNGLLLAQKPELARQLAEAGLSWVFLQFDGSNDAIYRALRGRPLLETKLEAVDNCRAAGLSVVLVPTLARGVNDLDLGNLLDLALSLTPTVRGLHLQPMTASGRNDLAGRAEPLTLPETLQALCAQSKGRIRPEHAVPPGCEHERCSFHCRYRLSPSGRLIPLRGQAESATEQGAATARQAASCCPAPWEMPGNGPAPCCPAPFAVNDGERLPPDEDGAGRAIEVILRAWQGPDKGPASKAAPAPAVAAGPYGPAGLAGLAGPAAGPAAGADAPDAAAVAAVPHAAPAPALAAAPYVTDAFEAFIAEARARSFSVTCMAFQDVMNVDLARLQGCCVHVFAPPGRLIPFCARNMTSLSGAALHPRSADWRKPPSGYCPSCNNRTNAQDWDAGTDY